ncbi:hypothetical protein BGZ88_003413 [Linnemannia elongata]|nr:hypothetical protein BGZ88_003413 [Linnemannia elongata]
MEWKAGAIRAVDSLMDVDAASTKRKNRDCDEERNTLHKKNRAGVPTTATTVIVTTTTFNVVNRTASGHAGSNSHRSVAINKVATTFSSSPIITGAWTREHDAALNHAATLSNRLKHRFEDNHYEELQDHDQEPSKRYKAQSKKRAPSTLSPSPTPSLMPSSSFTLSQTSSRRSSSCHRSSSSSTRSTSPLPKSSSSAPSNHPSPAPVDTKQASPKPAPMTLRSATRSLRSSTCQSSSPTPSTVAASESVDTSSHGGDDGWVKVRETAETMIVIIQTRVKKVTTKTRQERKDSAQDREVGQCISVPALIPDAPKQRVSDARSGPLVRATMSQSRDVELTKNSKNCNSSGDGEVKEVDETETYDNIPEVVQPNQYSRVKETAEILYTQEVTEAKAVQKRLSGEINDQREGCVDSKSVGIRRGNATRTEHEHPVSQNVDETEVDFELDIRGTQKRNNYPRQDCLPRVPSIPAPDQFHLRTLTRLVSSANSTSRKSMEHLYSPHARLVDENVSEVQLDPNHPWAQGPVEFISPQSRRNYHDEYRASDKHLGHNHHLQDYDDYSSQCIPSIPPHSNIRSDDIYSPHSSSYNSLPATTPHRSSRDSLQSNIHPSNGDGSRHSYFSTMAHVGETNSAPSFIHQAKRGHHSHHHSSSNDTADGHNRNNSNYSASPTYLPHHQNSTTRRYDTDENIPPPSYKASIFDFPSKKSAEPVPLILSTNNRTARAISSNNYSSCTNVNPHNHLPFDPNVVEESEISLFLHPRTNNHYLL